MALYRYTSDEVMTYTPPGRPPVIAINGTVIDWDTPPDGRWVLEPVETNTKESE